MDLTHIDEKGAARMVDVGDKKATKREATAQAVVRMLPGTLGLIVSDQIKKGDVFATARIAGIMAAKRTFEAIPLCHPIPVTKAAVEIEPREPDCVVIRATVGCTFETGVEMEALHAAAVAALTIYDMCKAVDRGMTIESVMLLEKSGGRSGHYVHRARPMVEAVRFAGGTEVSLLDAKAQRAMKEKSGVGLCIGRFKADLVTSGVDYGALGVGDKFEIGKQRFTVSRVKECFDECRLHQSGEHCPLRLGAIFATVDNAVNTGCPND
jgi:cyclic pyranopterin phosphate synthase